jgi:nicotinate-nucleotide--dimethylbenzimidazole phosphoribosyltransferase
MQRIQNLIQAVKEPDYSLAEKAQAHLDNLTKPLGALGHLESLAKTLCIMRGTLELNQPKPATAVFAGDHGVALAGASLYPREVTAQMVYNFLAGGAGINVLCRQANAAVTVVDVGGGSRFRGCAGSDFGQGGPGHGQSFGRTGHDQGANLGSHGRGRQGGGPAYRPGAMIC